jgi:hypothetical protein
MTAQFPPIARVALPEWPRLMNDRLAAAYLSIGTTLLRDLLPPKKLRGRAVWDRRDLDRLADALAGQTLDESDEPEIDLSPLTYNPPSFVLQFCERVVLLEGRLVQAGAVDPFAEEEGRKATTATSYVWLVWLDGERDTRFRWLAPCRERLERPSDYPNYAAEAPASADEGLFA